MKTKKIKLEVLEDSSQNHFSKELIEYYYGKNESVERIQQRNIIDILKEDFKFGCKKKNKKKENL